MATAAAGPDRLGDILIKEGLISREQLAQALAEQRASKHRLGYVLVMLGLVRPGMKLLKAPPVTLTPINGQQPQLSAVLNDTPDRPGLPMPGMAVEGAPPPEQLRLENAKRLAKENPMAVANIVKGWVNGEAPA